jgi:hypothetical protein
MPLDQADGRDFGIPAYRPRGAPGAAPGRPMNFSRAASRSTTFPRMFAALLPIALAGVASFVFMIALSKFALGQWHESEIGAD